MLKTAVIGQLDEYTRPVYQHTSSKTCADIRPPRFWHTLSYTVQRPCTVELEQDRGGQTILLRSNIHSTRLRLFPCNWKPDFTEPPPGNRPVLPTQLPSHCRRRNCQRNGSCHSPPASVHENTSDRLRDAAYATCNVIDRNVVVHETLNPCTCKMPSRMLQIECGNALR